MRKHAETEATPKKKKPFYLRWWFILLVVLALFIGAVALRGKGEAIAWEDMVLGEWLPEPPASRGKLYDNSVDRLNVDIYDVTDKEYVDYVDACKEAGFTVDAHSESYGYTAYNAEGYYLDLGHYGSDGDLDITLNVPMELAAISWPTSAAGQQLPKPESTVGRVDYDREDGFALYVGNMSKQAYAAYVDACMQQGFTVDYDKDDADFSAQNAAGWELYVEYKGFNILYVRLDAPDEEVAAPTTTTTTTAAKPAEGGVRADFKAAMDSYEAFMDEYVDFMKKYKANPTDLGLLAEYSDYMQDYAEFVKNFEQWEGQSLNTAETAYYIDVQARVSKKLLEVAQ